MKNIKELFPEFYQSDLTAQDLSESNNNIIVFDTNYLLDILQQPTKLALKYVEALEKVKDNIYIPYLVALEFNFQKSNIKKRKIKNIQRYKDELRDPIKKIKGCLKPSLLNEEDIDSFTTDLIELTDKFEEELLAIADDKVKSFITNEENELYTKLLEIIGDRIGDSYSNEWIDDVQTEGETRYEEGLPPGFNDSSKDDKEDATRQYGDIKYQRKYGDLLIWKDILNYSKSDTNTGKKVIFVTNDGVSKKKTDLIYKVDGMTVGPSIHLMNELHSSSGKELYILNNLRFIQLVNDLTDEEINSLGDFYTENDLVSSTSYFGDYKEYPSFSSYANTDSYAYEVNNIKNNRENYMKLINDSKFHVNPEDVESLIIKKYMEEKEEKEEKQLEENLKRTILDLGIDTEAASIKINKNKYLASELEYLKRKHLDNEKRNGEI